MKKHHFYVNTDLNKIIDTYNKTQPKTRVTTLDAILLNMILFSDDQFVYSNKELGNILIADPSTVQRSIDRLVSLKLVNRKIVYDGNTPRRILTVNTKNLDTFGKNILDNMDAEKRCEVYADILTKFAEM